MDFLLVVADVVWQHYFLEVEGPLVLLLVVVALYWRQTKHTDLFIDNELAQCLMLIPKFLVRYVGNFGSTFIAAQGAKRTYCSFVCLIENRSVQSIGLFQR